MSRQKNLKMKEVIIIGKVRNLRIFIRNRWTTCFSYNWHLINIERSFHQDRIEYKFCLIGFELVVLRKTNF